MRVHDQVYEGKVEPFTMSDNCTDRVPVLLRRATFCSAFAADARDFRSYNSWVRATLGFSKEPSFLVCTHARLHEANLLYLHCQLLAFTVWHACCCRRTRQISWQCLRMHLLGSA